MKAASGAWKQSWVAAVAIAGMVTSAAAWEPTKPVEFIVPAGTGGGADQMARFIQGVAAKNNLMKQPIVVVNKSGGAGAEGFLDVKGDKGNPHKIIITLSNLFTTPLATGVPFNWRDLTPVSMMALDQFVLWVNAESPYQTPKDFFAALKNGPDRSLKIGGTGSKQEDQIITAILEKAAGKKVTYVPYKGGGEVAVQLVGKHVDATVNNPIEAESHWRAGKLRALCVFDAQKLPYTKKVTATQSWADLPTCSSAGLPAEYVMLRGIFMAPGVTPEQTQYYVDLMAKVRALPEWKEFMEKGAFNQTTMSGQAYFDWVAKTEQMHRVLMRDAGFLAQ
ncbi:MAG: tripartite tricarboxylate transporter substrate binding protein [Rubrivivax sp.]|jgi:tripartite-type tricarboxylate transporter receptor subunit TctC|nr:tripartite tricarboxylate transporter substrate binding protein [Betaproteobacteria bacterium]MBP6317863.1 tripartite tricarboxylate transporter substrate binding protein [Rubrivivax sp.]MBK7277711.1 tripartite tricarboxylate transporter substrate binding protein [Betaproteobacteria bacterium]MBK7457632.1 tripartite tricarboxylate transporter substrate binding protein [Betaproteobacteria bacterium]MBK7514172.1 tripartite tricarboxylate transporter substrate binding protein [Betaproteobacteri